MSRSVWLSMLLAACAGRTEPAPAPSPAPTEPAPEAPAPKPTPAPADEQVPVETTGATTGPFEGTVGTTDVPRDGAPPARVVDVRTGRHEGYDRVVFQFAGALPGYHVEYVDKPVRQCGSGDTVPVAGDAWLQVQLRPADGHDEQGRATAGERSRKTPELQNVLQLERTCDYEADVTVVLGLASPNPYRVLELKDPSRLVIDVRHHSRR